MPCGLDKAVARYGLVGGAYGRIIVKYMVVCVAYY